MLGLSSYPYLGGFSEPEEIPVEYYSRIGEGRSLPLLITEGGWPSASVRGAFRSSPAIQARYIRRHAEILEHANAVAAYQLPFADLDWGASRSPLPKILPLFATLGLVDSNLRATPALATWDTVFAED